jgi:hypothetical protein
MFLVSVSSGIAENREKVNRALITKYLGKNSEIFIVGR